MLQRDKQIIQYLKHFRVLSRDHLASLVCPEVARPHVTINRILKRMARENWITPIPRPKELQYLYMPNPTMIHPSSTKTYHFLGLADIYLKLNRPSVYEVEPIVNDEYRPDVYTRIDGTPILIEYQRSNVSSAKMQDKVTAFAESYIRKQHDAKVLWIISDYRFRLKVPTGFEVVCKKMDAL